MHYEKSTFGQERPRRPMHRQFKKVFATVVCLFDDDLFIVFAPGWFVRCNAHLIRKDAATRKKEEIK
jgi:hypothetical protein